MLSANNLLKPVNGRAVTVPSQDMVLGAYYLTLEKEGEKGEGKSFRNFDEAVMAYENGIISLHARINVIVTKEINGVQKSGLTTHALGRLIFNKPIPQDLGFVDRSKPENEFKLEIDFTATKDELGQLSTDASNTTATRYLRSA
jgi:DNA-directed RNA polymerase subunit beta'